MVYRFILLKENLRLIWALGLKMNGQDFIKTKSYLASNMRFDGSGHLFSAGPFRTE
jgi:hypothetical protein